MHQTADKKSVLVLLANAAHSGGIAVPRLSIVDKHSMLLSPPLKYFSTANTL